MKKVLLAAACVGFITTSAFAKNNDICFNNKDKFHSFIVENNFFDFVYMKDINDTPTKIYVNPEKKSVIIVKYHTDISGSVTSLCIVDVGNNVELDKENMSGIYNDFFNRTNK